MRYAELIDLYFARSNALQWYWTVYVIVVGGLLAFSSLRQRPDTPSVILVTVLFAFFAYKNLGAIRDVSTERFAILSAIKATTPTGENATEVKRVREVLEPTLNPPDYGGVRNFHIASDLVTIAAFWSMEWRRRRIAAERVAVVTPAGSP